MATNEAEAAASLERGWALLASADETAAAQAERLAKAALALIRAQEALDEMKRSKPKDPVLDDAELEALKATLLERLDRLAARLEAKGAAGGAVDRTAAFTADGLGAAGPSGADPA